MTTSSSPASSTAAPAWRAAPAQTAQVLTQALPYIQRFAGATIVVKFGGNAMSDPALFETFAGDIVLMHSVGFRPVVVHGGGPQIKTMLERVGKESKFVNGLRVTDEETLEVVRMVLVGKVNRDIVAAINTRGGRCVGVSGEDGGLIRATPRDPELGFVGDVESVDPTVLNSMLAEGMIPVVSTIGSDADGQAYNINADTVAAELAAALSAEKLIMLTDVEGLRSDPEDPDSLIRRITPGDLAAMVGTPAVAGGMIPKVEACLTAIDGGVDRAHMLNGTTPHVLLLELFTDEGIGTMIADLTHMKESS